LADLPYADFDAPLIQGVVLRPLKVNRDPRGHLTEALRTDWQEVAGDDLPFAQMYFSHTLPGVARDEDQWHVHVEQHDRFVIADGAAVFALADLRPDSPTFPAVQLFRLAGPDAEGMQALLTVPPRVLHCFLALPEAGALLVNFPTRLYNPEDEGRIPFADAGVQLPSGERFAWDLVRADVAG
jgi:dTDP-4-dehydrorhamnose 3,5-epimerase